MLQVESNGQKHQKLVLNRLTLQRTGTGKGPEARSYTKEKSRLLTNARTYSLRLTQCIQKQAHR